MDHGWIPSNPFLKLKSTALAATTRHYVSPEDTEALLSASPGLQWKILIGLARYAGSRIPSEAFAITWDMVDWDKKALFIPKRCLREGDGDKSRQVGPSENPLVKIWGRIGGSKQPKRLASARNQRRVPKSD